MWGDRGGREEEEGRRTVEAHGCFQIVIEDLRLLARISAAKRKGKSGVSYSNKEARRQQTAWVYLPLIREYMHMQEATLAFRTAASNGGWLISHSVRLSTTAFITLRLVSWV